MVETDMTVGEDIMRQLRWQSPERGTTVTRFDRKRKRDALIGMRESVRAMDCQGCEAIGTQLCGECER